MLDPQWISILVVELLIAIYIHFNSKRLDKIDSAIKELKKTQTEAKRPKKVRLWHNIYVGDCPDCHRIVRFAQKHCHNCTRLLDWTEVLEMPHDEDEEE